ncbi:MAG: DNA cytosine methyltransferase [Nitrospiraceae bacterium]|nr:MAG: DNA cytosine methyltransferase [Nitrospiraceae bacterium]
MSKYRCYDICCGAGVFAAAFKRAGYKILGGIDSDKDAIATARHNIPDALWENISIEDFSKKIQKNHPLFRANVIIAGLPCQGFSVAGKCEPDDYRNYLYRYFLRIVKRVKPDYIVIENVQGLLHERNKDIFKEIISGLNKEYEVDYRIYDAVNLGTPQYRKRVFIIASKKIPVRYIFENVRFSPEQKTVCEALINIDPKNENVSFNHTFMRHGKNVLEKIKSINSGGPISYRRLIGDQPSLTIISGHNALPLHPEMHRALSNREAARIQGIPDNFIFKGSRTQQTVQIANVVPYPMAMAVAQSLRRAPKTMQTTTGKLCKLLTARTDSSLKTTFRRGFVTFFRKRGRKYKWRAIKNPYRILITEILLQRTKGDMVNEVWQDVITACNPKSKHIDLGILEKVFNKIGLQYKIETITKLNSALGIYFNGKVPPAFDELMQLPGVGIYIASATRTFAFNIPDFPVDSNCFRFINRFYGLKIKGKKSEARQLREFMNSIITKKNPKEFVYGFIDFCAEICAPRNPKCEICFISKLCMHGISLRTQ